MTELVPFLVFCQALGAIAGAIAALWAEISYLHAMRDHHISQAERTHLNHLARGLRYGMTLVLISSLGIVVASYTEHLPIQPGLSAQYWTMITISLLIIALSWGLSRGRVSFALGSAAAATAWLFLVYLASHNQLNVSYGSIIALYVVATAVAYAIFFYIRFVFSPRT